MTRFQVTPVQLEILIGVTCRFNVQFQIGVALQAAALAAIRLDLGDGNARGDAGKTPALTTAF